MSPELVLGWSMWLLISWAINWGIDTPVWGRSESLIPAMRGLTQSMMIGIGLIWPAWRLSQVNREFAGRRTLVDLAWLLIVLQAVLWILANGLNWSTEHTVIIDAVICTYAAAVAVCVWAGWRMAPGIGRSVAMIGCTAVVGLGLVVTAMTGQMEPARWSPFYLLWALVDPFHRVAGEAVFARLQWVGILTAVVWLALLIWRPRRPEHRPKPV